MGISKSAFAKHEGVSKGRVSQWLKSGVITCLPDGSIDPEEGERDLLKNRDAFKRIDWEASQPRRFSLDDDATNKDGSFPPWFTGNPVRDIFTSGIIDFYNFLMDRTVSMNLKLYKELQVDVETAKGFVVLNAMAVLNLTEEYLLGDHFSKTIGPGAMDDLWRDLRKRLPNFPISKVGAPKRIDIRLPKSILKILEHKGVKTALDHVFEKNR